MLTELTKSVQSVQSDGMKTHTLIKASTAVSLLHTKGHQRNYLLYVTKIFISSTNYLFVLNGCNMGWSCT